MLYIYTVCYNTPEYIEPQFKLLKKFIKNDFEYLVFNNTMTNSVINNKNKENNLLLQKVCNKYNIKTIDLPRQIFQKFHDNDASGRAGTAINAANSFLFSNYSLESTFFLIDSDAFLLNDFDVEKFMNNKSLSGRIQFRKGKNFTVKYITNHIVIYKPSYFDKSFKIYFSFLPCNIDSASCDCGGNIHYIFNKLDDSKFINWENKLFSKFGNIKQQRGTAPDSKKDFNIEALTSINNSKLKNYILQDTSILKKEFPFCEILENTNNNTIFLHMRAGTNWINYNIENRNKILFTFLNESIN